MNRNLLRTIILEEFFNIMEFKPNDDLYGELQVKMNNIKDPKYKALFLASMAHHMGIDYNELMTMVRKIYKDSEKDKQTK